MGTTISSVGIQSNCQTELLGVQIWSCISNSSHSGRLAVWPA
jgi:hypothetical protein